MGARVQATTLAYAPFLVFDSCGDSEDSPCQVSGMVVDLFNLMARKSNFTWEIYREPSGLWGSMPFGNGTAADAVGVIGAAINHLTDVPLSVWGINL